MKLQLKNGKDVNVNTQHSLVHVVRTKTQKLGRIFADITANDEGQGISEYLIILAVVVIAAIALATTFSDQLSALWGSITSQLQAIS